MPEGEWYYCLKHHAVEPYRGCKAEDRLGPYPTREDAARALQRVRERNKAWDAQDAADRGEGEQEDEPGDGAFHHRDWGHFPG